jgi:hypothetical protein
MVEFLLVAYQKRREVTRWEVAISLGAYPCQRWGDPFYHGN